MFAFPNKIQITDIAFSSHEVLDHNLPPCFNVEFQKKFNIPNDIEYDFSYKHKSKLIDPDDFFEKRDDSIHKIEAYAEETTDTGITDSCFDICSPIHQDTETNAPKDMEVNFNQSSYNSWCFKPVEVPQISKPADLATILSADNKLLIYAINCILEGLPLDHFTLENLSEIEKAVIFAITEKKELNEKMNLKNQKKREEEKQKMFFKGVLKHTELKFFDEIINSKKYTKKKTTDKLAYYEYYWGQVSADNGINLSNFYHPNKKIASGKGKNKIKNPTMKSLNSTYISLILSSQEFKLDTAAYLEQNFIQDYKKSREKKIGKMLNRLGETAFEALDETRDITNQVSFISQSLRTYLVQNSKSKIPWSDAELREAYDFAARSLSKPNCFDKIVKILQ